MNVEVPKKSSLRVLQISESDKFKCHAYFNDHVNTEYDGLNPNYMMQSLSGVGILDTFNVLLVQRLIRCTPGVFKSVTCTF